MLQPDVKAQVDSVVSALTLGGHPALEIIPPRTGTELMLGALTVDDTDEILQALYPNEADPFGLDALAADKAKADALKAQTPAFGQPPALNPPALPPPAEAALLEAAVELARAIKATRE